MTEGKLVRPTPVAVAYIQADTDEEIANWTKRTKTSADLFPHAGAKSLQVPFQYPFDAHSM
jgi:hypothetical protein